MMKWMPCAQVLLRLVCMQQYWHTEPSGHSFCCESTDHRSLFACFLFLFLPVSFSCSLSFFFLFLHLRIVFHMFNSHNCHCACLGGGTSVWDLRDSTLWFLILMRLLSRLLAFYNTALILLNDWRIYHQVWALFIGCFRKKMKQIFWKSRKSLSTWIWKLRMLKWGSKLNRSPQAPPHCLQMVRIFFSSDWT